MILWSNKENFPLIIPATPSYLDHGYLKELEFLISRWERNWAFTR